MGWKIHPVKNKPQQQQKHVLELDVGQECQNTRVLLWFNKKPLRCTWCLVSQGSIRCGKRTYETMKVIGEEVSSGLFSSRRSGFHELGLQAGQML